MSTLHAGGGEIVVYSTSGRHACAERGVRLKVLAPLMSFSRSVDGREELLIEIKYNK